MKLSPSSLFLSVAIATLVSCDRPDPVPEKSFDEVFQESKDSTSEKIDALITKIEETTKLHAMHRAKAEFVSDAAKTATLDFKQGNALLYYSTAPYMPVEQQYQFYTQQALSQLKSTFAAPPSEYLTNFKEFGRIDSFNKLVENGNLFASNLKFVVLLESTRNTSPSFRGADFVPGTYEGTLMVFELGNTNPIAIKKFTAQSSPTVSYKKGDITAAIASVKSDYRENVDAAIEKAVKSITSVEGHVPSLLTTFP
ncbi:MAG: hypothetical protein NWT08_01630 [Akkermansiaceae bacterium]|jgi:hypothetical protein|nr:hypothetical protein [Akkermansiaceae bacterium]MDP4645561.1 hypothetical protein [Akkermansiaceae bacterium]MDP4720370.1 hypothetical protein [Akkermansiaceae bacterium]MDP4779355.1 hypothetical protein [Akkermansiaceae bacterium]MDP4848645.1 hypothetical protein [Akkermansiaceae bacterium]